MGEEEGKKRINFLPLKYHTWAFIFSFTRESLRDEKRKKAGREGEREVREISTLLNGCKYPGAMC